MVNDEQKSRVAAAREKAFMLYEGKQVSHRSCGICLAETFNLPTEPYQALRKGGITGEGECGAIKAGELILGQYLGDPDPTGTVTQDLCEAVQDYREAWSKRVDRGAAAAGTAGTVIGSEDIVCNHLTGQFSDFMGEDRQRFCTNIAAEVAEIVAELLVKYEVDFEIVPVDAKMD